MEAHMHYLGGARAANAPPIVFLLHTVQPLRQVLTAYNSIHVTFRPMSQANLKVSDNKNFFWGGKRGGLLN
jgi:hypothetical protein